MSSLWTDDLDKTRFYLEMITNLTSSLERVIGYEDTEGYLALVGSEMGHDLYKAYCSDSGKPDLTAEAIAKVLVAQVRQNPPKSAEIRLN